MADIVRYTPPPTVREFIKDYLPGQLFYDWIVGPVGSGKTTGNFFKLAFMAKRQAPGPDGVRRSRCVIVRNTAPQLRDTTIASWFGWFKHGQAGEWQATPKNFILRFDDVECEVLFRALDTPDDVSRVLSLEVTFAIVDEFVEIPRDIIEALSGRLGRFPAKKDGGATNWGMWGSSNASTEDNWWFEYLHDHTVHHQMATMPSADARAARYALEGIPAPNAKFFVQPSGFAPNAENLENLPGERGYYTSAAKGKSDVWIKQFIECEWGFSIAGTPVVKSYRKALHVVPSLQWNPKLPLIAGFDPGIGGTALILGQQDLRGRLLCLGEIITTGVGAQRFATEYVKPYLRQHFPGFPVHELILAPDPAAANRAQTDEKSVVDELKKHFRVSIESNNRLAIRLDAIESFTTRLTEQGPALLIDQSKCPTLVRALGGGWRYALDPKRGVARSVDPEKNQYSHPGDAFGYLCRYFHRGAERAARHAHSKFTPPRTFGPSYHLR